MNLKPEENSLQVRRVEGPFPFYRSSALKLWERCRPEEDVTPHFVSLPSWWFEGNVSKRKIALEPYLTFGLTKVRSNSRSDLQTFKIIYIPKIGIAGSLAHAFLTVRMSPQGQNEEARSEVLNEVAIDARRLAKTFRVNALLTLLFGAAFLTSMVMKSSHDTQIAFLLLCATNWLWSSSALKIFDVLAFVTAEPL